jgi:hypothetical protein
MLRNETDFFVKKTIKNYQKQPQLTHQRRNHENKI